MQNERMCDGEEKEEVEEKEEEEEEVAAKNWNKDINSSWLASMQPHATVNGANIQYSTEHTITMSTVKPLENEWVWYVAKPSAQEMTWEKIAI